MTARLRVISVRRLRLAACAVGMAVAAVSAGGKDRPSQKVTPQGLDALARQYRDAGLPLPPPDAPLVLVQREGYSSPGGDHDAAYLIGFKLEPDGENDSTARFLMGTQKGEGYNANEEFSAIRPLDAARGLPPPAVTLIADWQAPTETFSVNNWLALAIQCHLRGYDRLAGQIFARGLTRNESAGQDLTPGGNGSPRDALAATAWNYWMNVLCTEGTDRREVLAHLEKLSTEFPALDGPFQRDYLATLRLATVPGKGAPESVEALVDALVDHTGMGGNSGNDVNEPDYAHLQGLGFEAVPALIAHLDDRRLTRSVTTHDDDAHIYPRCVNEVVCALIGDIAGADQIPNGFAGRPRERPADKEAVARWWAKASALGEETYMTSYLFPPTEVGLQIVAERYPRHLGEIYARILKEKPETDCHLILAEISICAALGREEQRRLIHLGIDSPDLGCFLEAHNALMGFDPADADAALIVKFEHWPTDFTPTNPSPGPAVAVGDRVLISDSAAVWQAYERALFRASVALRMEMLGRLVLGSRNIPQNVRRLALLDLFLDDEEVRVLRKEDVAPGGRFEGAVLTPDTQRLSVGNFAAGLLAQLLNFKPPPGKAHTGRWWAEYRHAARAAIDQQARTIVEAPAIETP